MKKKIITICAVVLFLMALGLTLYPLVSNYVNRKYASEIQTAYQELIQQTDDSVLQEAMQRAIAYNLAITPGTADAYSEEALVTAAEDYGNQLDIAGNGIMGYVEIPKIQVRLEKEAAGMSRSKCGSFSLMVLLMLFLAGLFLVLYPSVQGAVVDRRMGWEADSFLARLEEDPDKGTPNVIIPSTEPEEPRPYPELWESITTYNQRIYIDGQSTLSEAGAYQAALFNLTDYGLPDETFGVISIPKENIPKQRKKVRQRIYDEATGKAKTVSVYQEVDRPPDTKLRHDPLRMPLQRLEQEIHNEVHKVEQENVGVEAGHKGEELAERGLRLGEHGIRQVVEHQRQKPWRDVEKAQRAFDQANAEFTYQKAVQGNPNIASSNPVSRYLQKKRIQRQYTQQMRQARRTADATGKSFGGIKGSLREFIQKVKQSKGYLVVILGIGVLLLFLIGGVSSCSVMAGSGISSFVSTSYLSEDKDMLDAESAYCAMEAELQNRLRNYERTHSYDEYHFEMDTIEHDPYVLISLLSALHDGVFTIDQVKDDLNRLFGLQYILTETVETETRYRTETEIAQRPMRDPKTGKVLLDKKGQPIMEDYEVEVEVPYIYTICTVTLKNRNLSHIPVEILGEDGLSMYAAYMATLGNREDLFPNSSYVGKYSETPPKYEIPSEVLADETFSALITEAEKYIGMPYVRGGSNPNTSFDCSGFICWSMGNSSVWNVGRTSAQGLYNLCTPVSKANAQPGDLIFFKGTYDTPGISHVGLYVGAGKMLHCGDPIRYVDINTTYWQAHFYAFARPPYQ